MKKTVCVLGVVLAATFLPGCEVTGPHVKLKPPITVDDGHRDHDRHDHDNNDGDFCPPGQAKKGRC